MTVSTTGTQSIVVLSVLTRYRAGVAATVELAKQERAESSAVAEIALDFPDLGPGDAEFFAASEVALHEVDGPSGHRLRLLDLMRNPGTRTTKTLASLMIVARAVAHSWRTGEPIMIVTPTSANKGTALRDAVARAYRAGVATPEHLRIVVVAPAMSRHKLRDSPLSVDSALRRANPVVVAEIANPADVKGLAVAAVTRCRTGSTTQFRLWNSLDLDNYRIADSVRAFVEAGFAPITDAGRGRIHAHAISSAFGLLGYHLGTLVLAGNVLRLPRPQVHPGFFLVQQLATPDMVLSHLTGSPSHDLVPKYHLVPKYRRDGTSPWCIYDSMWRGV